MARWAFVAPGFIALCLQGLLTADPLYFVAALIGLILIWKAKRTVDDAFKVSPWLFVAALALGIFAAIGIRYTALDSVQLHLAHYVMLFTIVVGDAAICYSALLWLQWRLSHTSKGNYQPGEHSWAFAAIVIFACWLPYLIIFFPGSVPYDGFLQLDMYFGIFDMTEHHPVVTTIFIGSLVSLGQAIFNDINMGVILFVVTQSIISASIYGFASRFIGQITGSRIAFVATVLFFAIHPIWGSWSQVLGKDTIYYAAVALLVIRTAKLVMESREANTTGWNNWLIWILSAIIVIAFRKEGCIIASVTSLALFIVLRESRAKGAASFGIVVITSLLLFVVATPLAIDKADSQKYDSYAIVFQQIARVVSSHEDELTEEESKAIDDVLEIGDLAKRYNPQNADPVKDRIGQVTDEQFSKLLRVWAKLGIRYPATYVSAFLNHSYCYYYPAGKCETFGPSKFYIMEEPLNTGELGIEYRSGELWEKARSLVSETVDTLASAPIIGLLFSSGFYTWIIIACLALVLQSRNRDYALAFIPTLLIIMICLVAPVNGYLRYSLPYISTAPIIIALTYRSFVERPRD